MKADNSTLINYPIFNGPLLQLFPNPANNFVTMNFTSKEESQAIISLDDIMGRNILSEITYSKAGSFSHFLNWDDINIGIYIVKIQVGNYLLTTKLIIE